MKTVFGSKLAPVALACLLCTAQVMATDVSTLPLKVSTQVKPNVVFALDDSGSMDSDVLFEGTYQGWFYGAYYNATTINKPDGTFRDGSGSYDLNLLYLFPNGSGPGNRTQLDPDTLMRYNYGLPPIPEVGWTRSPSYNTIYYDTRRTYVPWAPAFVNGALTSFGPADPNAAKSHPVNGSSTMALNAILDKTEVNWRFAFTVGMTIPAYATNVACLNDSFQGTLPYTVDSSRGVCSAAMPYYPATFWNREDCTVNGSTCVAAWDGRTVKRYEIKPGNTFPSGRSYADEMQNFANWFTYYRKRRLMLAAALGQVLEGINGVRLGVVPFNALASPTMYDADASSPADNRFAVSGLFYASEGKYNTPTHATLSFIRNQFDTNTNLIQWACQRNAQFVITDGFANDGAWYKLSYDQSLYGAGRPYSTTESGSLADQALAAFTLRLRSTGADALAAGRVPLGPRSVSNPDNNKNLHLQTYAMTLGTKGSVWPYAADPFVTPPTWPELFINRSSMIDDLWHATINGRGQMYLANEGAAAAAGIYAGLRDIISQVGAQGGVAVSSVNLDRGDSQAYLGSYNPAGWIGDLTANSIDRSTAEVSSTALWSASSLLNARDWTTRVIASYNGSAGVGFTESAVGTVVNPSGKYGTTADVISYLRGNRAGEGTSFRTRGSLIGAVINAEPVLSREDRMVYVASGEGMLHAFDTETGSEHWAFVPRAVLPNLGPTTARSYSFHSRLDATPAVGKTSNGNRLLVGAMGGAGRSYYALDVSSPRNLTEDQLAAAVRWEFPSSGDSTNQSLMGYSLGRPVIANATGGQGDVVLVTSGYDGGESIGDGKGRMWMLSASDGSVLRTFVTSEGASGAESGLTHVSAFREVDGTVRYAYAGDLLGNVWRFDLSDGSTFKVAVLKDSAGNPQPVTAPPELVLLSGRRVILVGTGRLLALTDFGSSRTQSFYAIADGTTLTNARSGLIARTFNRGASPQLSGASLDWTTDRGWYFDLPAGEQANTAPAIAYGTVAFTTNLNGASDCTQSSLLYVVDLGTGLKPESSEFASVVLSTSENASRITALRVSTGQVIGSTHIGNNSTDQRTLAEAPTISPAKTSWREIKN